jgi:hypothetical protein
MNVIIANTVREVSFDLEGYDDIPTWRWEGGPAPICPICNEPITAYGEETTRVNVHSTGPDDHAVNCDFCGFTAEIVL